MWHMSVPWWEIIVRSLLVYVFLLVILRVTGKRQVGQLAPFDLVLLLVLSNAVQNSMNGGDNSLVGGLISATTLIGLNYAVGTATFRSKKLEAIIEGRPEVLIHNGKLFEEVMAKAQLTHHELVSACARPAAPVSKRCTRPSWRTTARSPSPRVARSTTPKRPEGLPGPAPLASLLLSLPDYDRGIQIESLIDEEERPCAGHQVDAVPISKIGGVRVVGVVEASAWAEASWGSADSSSSPSSA